MDSSLTDGYLEVVLPTPAKDLLFSYPECIAVVWRWVVVAGSDGWVANQHTDNCCCPILLNPLICIVLPSYPLHYPLIHPALYYPLPHRLQTLSL